MKDPAQPAPVASDLMHFNPGTREGPLSRLLHQRSLTPWFQPIVSLESGAVFAHEALVRGPQNMPLCMPDALFAAARREGLLQDFEVACVVLALERWSALNAPGRLFLNISATALVRCFGKHLAPVIGASMRHFGVPPQRVVFEITEHENVSDIPRFIAVAQEVQAAGMCFALDDFGDGRSSLRLWSELGPDFVKIDKYFTREISQHARRLRTLRALMQIAETFGTTLVAEGVETSEDLRVLRDLGVPLVQGYFLGRPAPLPREKADAHAAAVLEDARVSVMPTMRTASSPGRLMKCHVIEAEPAPADATNCDIAARFDDHADLHAIALVNGDIAVALLGREQFLNRYAKPYFRELYGRKPCIAFANTSPVRIDVGADVNDLIQVLTSADQRYLNEGFIYTENGRYRGLGTGHQLVRQVTESRIEAARHANPLTLLPGNIPISEHIERLLAAGATFVCCYADLSDFKPFNDHFGYWRGDEVIKLLASTLQSACDPQCDFVGHVGGDDFVVLFQSADWLQRCERMVNTFNAAAVQLYGEEERQAGGICAEDRHGVKRFFGFTSLYMGAVHASAPSAYRAAPDVASAAARAKQQAKILKSPIYVDRPAPAASAHRSGRIESESTAAPMS